MQLKDKTYQKWQLPLLIVKIQILPMVIKTCGIFGWTVNGGESEIRTHDSLATMTAFQAVGLNHSPISPQI